MKWIVGIILAVILLGGGWAYLSGQIPGTKPYKPIVELAPKDERDYTRRFVGQYLSLDKITGTLALQNMDGKTYYFRVPMALIENDDADLAIPIGEKVRVAWRDSESLEQIMVRYSQDPTAPVNPDDNSFTISKIE